MPSSQTKDPRETTAHVDAALLEIAPLLESKIAAFWATAEGEAAYDGAMADLDTLWLRVKRMQARTFDGLRVKARLAQFHRDRCGGFVREGFADDDHEIGCNLIDDLLAN